MADTRPRRTLQPCKSVSFKVTEVKTAAESSAKRLVKRLVKRPVVKKKVTKKAVKKVLRARKVVKSTAAIAVSSNDDLDDVVQALRSALSLTAIKDPLNSA